MRDARNDKDLMKMREITVGRDKSYEGLSRNNINFHSTDIGQQVINGARKGIYFNYKPRTKPINKVMTN